MSRAHSPSRRLFAAGALALAASTVLMPQAHAGWGLFGSSEQVQGNGHIQRQARQVGGFRGLAVGLPGQVEVRTGTTEGVIVETDDNLLPLIETVVEDGTLHVRPKRNVNLRTRNLKIVVQTRGLESVGLGGSGTIDCDRVAGKHISLDVGGSGAMTVRKLQGDTIEVNLGGSGDLKVDEGSAHSLDASLGGSGTIDLARVRLDTAQVTIGGSGDVTVWVRDRLSMTAAGSGSVKYYGDPQVSKTKVGSGDARRLGAAPR